MSEPVVSEPGLKRPAVSDVRWWALSALALGVVGGVAWRLFADRGTVLITKTGAATTEEQSTHQFASVVLFLGIGAVLCVGWGYVTARRRPANWRIVPAVAIVSLLAGFEAIAVGLVLGPDKVVIAKDAKPGDHVPAILTFDVWAAPVAWAVCGLVGVLVAAWISARRHAGSRP